MSPRRPWLAGIGLLLVVVIGGWLLGKLIWESIPINVKVDKDTRYLLGYGRAKAFQGAGDLTNAVVVLESLIRKNPRRYEAYLSLGDILLKQGNTNAALSNYRSALKYCGQGATNLVSLELQRTERQLIEQRIRKFQE